MRSFALACLAAVLVTTLLAAPAAAQVKVTIAAIAPSGVALDDGAGKIVSQSFPTNQPFTSKATVNVQTHGTGSPYFIDWAETVIKPPLPWGTFYESIVAIESKSFAKKGTIVPSLFTTGAAAGQPGTQKYRVTLTSPVPQDVELSVWASGQNYGNASIKTDLAFGTTQRTWTWLFGAGYVTNHETFPLQVNGTLAIDVDITGIVTPGPGGGTYSDGYDTRWSLTVIPITAGSISYFGTSCSPATLGHVGTPTTGSHFTMKVDNAPPNVPVFFMLGTNNMFVPFLNIPLPYDLGPMGAPGCWLYVGSPFPWWVSSGSYNPPHTIDIYLSPWHSGTYFIQGLVLDPAANPGGLTTTQAVQLNF